MKDWIQQVDGACLLRVRVIPRASQTKIDGLHDGALKIRLKAPPVDGKANKALITFLSKTTGYRRSDLELTHGSTGRNKTLLIHGAHADDVRSRLGPV